ncbi:hypothetical protein NHX12_018925 [Muraenolepis orangiensis]|uniref:Notum n=1 Tax=Muraenolepis orangiensis TaxID=630683 RepID=A0A9Q0IYT5_9TELE|nr:hypothetical protein NHX12_018925 [Muraenolepis orangiensis]
MKLLGLVALLLLLEGTCCQNNRQSRTSGKLAKKTGNQGTNVSRSQSAEEVVPGGGGGAGGGGGGAVVGGAAEAAGQAPSGGGVVAQQSEGMRLQFLRNTQVTCNDGTAAGFYLKEFRGSRKWLLFLEGGWCCYNKETCDARYQNIPRLMSSSVWPPTRKGSGILSTRAEENPHWYNTNIVFIPYCSSDVWSGIGPADYTFMGSLIIREVIKDLIPKGIKQAKIIMLTGTSAGGTGVLLNIDRVASQLEQLGAEAHVRGLVDSGWFLESQQPLAQSCPETVSCSPEDAIKKGLRLWNGVVPNRCRQLYKRGEEWQCFFGHKLYASLTSPLFVVQWLFDEEQLRVENIVLGGPSLSEDQWTYLQNLGRVLKSSLRDVTAVFAPSCLSHTLITKSNWKTFQVKGTSLSRALQCWDRSFQDAHRNRTPSKGCPFHLMDTCQRPQCNPTCPALVDRATQQEMTLVQMLVAMGLDIQRLGLEPRREASSPAGTNRNGG